MDDLLQEFVAETTESIDLLDGELVRLEKEPNDPELLSNIFRVLHTIKGTCGFLGLPRLGAVAHAGENILDQLRNGSIEISQDTMNPVLEALDRIRAIVQELESTGVEPDGDDTDLVERLNAAAEGAPRSSNPSDDEKPPVNLFDEIGGLSTIDAAVELFFDSIAQDGNFASLLEDADLDMLQAQARGFLAKVLGGPGPHDGPDIDTIHQGLTVRGVDDTLLDVAIDCFGGTLIQLEVPEDVAAAIVELAHANRPSSVDDDVIDDASLGDSGDKKEANVANKPEERAAEAKKGAASIRVNVDVLESLMTVVSELVLTRNQLLQILRTQKESEFSGPLQRLNQVTTELQESVMLTRMQPIGKAWAKLPRIVRDLSKDLNKKIDLVMEGAETELDRQVLDEIKDPLTHMVRNAADHGLEGGEERTAAGKQEMGRITLSARHEGGHIILEIADDGRGLDTEKIKEKVISNGLANDAELEGMTEQQIQQFIFNPGFSTATEVTSVSGRGVGMDVVATNIAKIGGSVELFSKKGKGTKFTVKIPLTLAIVSALIVECSEQRFALPQSSVVELVRVAKKSVNQIEEIKGVPVLRLRDRLLPLVPLKSLLDIGDDYEGSEIYIIVARVGSYHFGIIVDRVFDTEEIVVKPVVSILRDMPIYAGNTILGDGSVIMILDPSGIARENGEVSSSGDHAFDAEEGAQSTSESTSMLVFRAGSGVPKAVPVGLVARIEEIRSEQIEFAGGRRSIQYRDRLMPLLTISEDQSEEANAVLPVLVFSERDRSVGLIADEIVDIVDSDVQIEMGSDQDGTIGTAIIDGKATELIDTTHYIGLAHSNWFDVSYRTDFGEETQQKLLLVDDSSFFRNLLTPILETAGYEVSQASDGQQALEACQYGNRFDVIVSDLEMPNLNGFEFVSKLRSLEEYTEIPVVALSSHASRADVERCLSAGFTAHIEKLNRGRLIEQLNGQLKMEAYAT